jgi:predicted enzyme related to lactoylglutathione lyase
MLAQPSETCNIFHSSDLDRAERFYRDVFGIAFEPRGIGAERLLFARLSPVFSISIMRGEGQPGTSPLLTFTLADGGIADVVDALAHYGATIVSPVGPAPEGHGATLRDADGHLLGLYQTATQPLSRKDRSQ